MNEYSKIESLLQNLSEKEFVSLTFNNEIKEKFLHKDTYYIIGLPLLLFNN